MPIFIKLKDTDRELLFDNVKQNINCSWNFFYPKLNIGKTMFFYYLSGRYSIPQDIFKKLEKIANIKIKNYQKIFQNRNIEKNIKIPKMGKKLAEIFGILNGDGHLAPSNKEICVVGNLAEKNYFNYMKKLFDNTFQLNFTIYPQPYSLKLRTFSKRLFNLLNKEYGLPGGNKLGKLKIPLQVYQSEKFLKSYIKGLYDTDGSFYIRRKKDPVIQITSADTFF